MLYLLRLLIACLALTSGARVAEGAAERGAATVTIEAPQGARDLLRSRVRRDVRRPIAVARARIVDSLTQGVRLLPRAFERLRSGAAPLYLLHRALLR